MPRRWHQSLYWRIALGLFAFLAIMLLAEAAMFLWMTERIAGSMPARSPRRLAVLVASDVSALLTANPSVDLVAYVRSEYADTLQTFLIVLRDGRVVANHDDVPDALMIAARVAATREAAGQPPRGGRRGRGAGVGAGARGEVAPIIVDGAPAGRVIVLAGGPPFSRILRRFGPTIGLVAGGVLIVGSALIAVGVFGPVRRRLRQLQAATERLGAGDLTARAPEDGRDEVALLARSFNRMADDLAGRARALEESDKARRQLLADVSHELMTPLTAMRGYIETLTMGELQLERAMRERYLRIALDETHRLEHIIGDLLDLARLEGGGGALRREPVDVAMLFERVAARHERELRDRGIRLTREVARGAERVVGDADRLEQALQNLAANALRYTPDGGRIALSAAPHGSGRVLVVVRDNGPGIPDAHLPLIFDRFYKADASRRARAGSGLGLSIVKAIVERHGGSISARNENGAVFELTLPVG